MAVLASAQMSGCPSRDRTTLQRTDASQMNATDVMLAEPATAHGASMLDENVPDAPPSPSSDYSRVIEALAGSARTPYMLTIPAQLAAMLRARIGSGKLAPHRPIPGEPALLRQYGVAPETSRKACVPWSRKVLHSSWRAAAPTSHRRDTHPPPPRLRTNPDPRR